MALFLPLTKYIVTTEKVDDLLNNCSLQAICIGLVVLI